MPHLRHRTEDQICLLSIQFFSAGGSFKVEVATCVPDGYTSSTGRAWPANKVTAQALPPMDRPRLGNPHFPAFGDHWFGFGPRRYDPGAAEIQAPEQYSRVAERVLRLLHEQAEPWWRGELAQDQDHETSQDDR